MIRSRLRATTPLRRFTPLQSKSWPRRRPPRRREREGANPAYVSWVHTQPCVGRRFFPDHRCGDTFGNPTSAVEQSHERTIANGAGTGVKEHDIRSVAMCHGLAVEWEEHRGTFRGWSKELRREWMADRVAEHNAAFEAASLVQVPL